MAFIQGRRLLQTLQQQLWIYCPAESHWQKKDSVSMEERIAEVLERAKQQSYEVYM